MNSSKLDYVLIAFKFLGISFLKRYTLRRLTKFPFRDENFKNLTQNFQNFFFLLYLKRLMFWRSLERWKFFPLEDCAFLCNFLFFFFNFSMRITFSVPFDHQSRHNTFFDLPWMYQLCLMSVVSDLVKILHRNYN